MAREKLDTHQKALRLNLDRNKYGTIAEIGAGQEVARWFFRVGGAAGTIAKSMSAYDMAVSDAIYGASTRYVSRERVLTMLGYEFHLLDERLTEKRGPLAQFFVFANSVTARSYSRRKDETHGWMGLRFQHVPGAEPSDIIIHVRMLDPENVQQQEALGILGVNLIDAGFHLFAVRGDLMDSLLDGLTRERIEVNLMRCTGPAFDEVDHRLLALELVARRLTEATMFRADGEVVDAGELLYKKPLLIVRGSFCPVTNTVMDLVGAARERLLRESAVDASELVLMAGMTLRSLRVGGGSGHDDFLDRVDTLAALGMNVLITNAYRDFRLASYAFQHTKRKIGAVVGLPALEELFHEEYYGDLEGGILEALGRLFKNDLRLYVYPVVDPIARSMTTVQNMNVAPHLRHLLDYLLENRFIEGLDLVEGENASLFPKDVLAMIQSNQAGWERFVPDEVVELIKKRRLFRYPGG
jgi:hypothetical protein